MVINPIIDCEPFQITSLTGHLKHGVTLIAESRSQNPKLILRVLK
jgi:hypothetical protein